MIDSHQHFWAYDPRAYDWMAAGMDVLRRDHLPTDLAPLLREAGVDGTVAVQARRTEAETTWLLGLADDHAFVWGVVGPTASVRSPNGPRWPASCPDWSPNATGRVGGPAT